MSGSRSTIAGEDRLDNAYPGDVLREEFLIGTALPLQEVAEGVASMPTNSRGWWPAKRRSTRKRI